MLHVSQSGVSAQVAKLERELGVRLFERGRRTATLTSEGANLLPLMSAALDDITNIEQTAGEIHGLTRGNLRIGTIIGCSIPGYLSAFAEFRSAYPEVRLNVREGNSAELITQLSSGDIDIALLAHTDPLPAQFDVTTFISEPIVAGVPVGHAWTQKPAVSAEDLAAANILTLTEGTGIRTALQRTCSIAGIEVKPAVEAHSPETVHALAARGAGVAVLSTSMITAPLTAVAIEGAELARLSVASRARPGAAVRTFMRTLRAHLPDLSAG